MEGKIPFNVHVSGQQVPCSTYYKVFGDVSSSAPRVVVLHGGPGGGHEYLLSFAQLWPKHGLPVVLYDQIGCGASTHLPETAGDTNFWQEPLFIAELDNLLDHLKLRDGSGFHLLGQSWGGLLAGAFAASRPRGLQRLVLASAMASIELATQSIEMCKKQLSEDTQNTLNKYIQEGDYESPAFQEAAMVFRCTFVCRADLLPKELMEALKRMNEDKTVYGTMYGPSVFNLNGSLLGWTSIPRLPQIAVPTLVYNGEYDTSHDIGQEPYFKLIPRVRWITFSNGGHMCHLENGLAERVLKVVGEFLVGTK
ncbi:proline-specific peptidase [Apodospora peruviana]|uniref:Proline-specific peptidase n=1 Tax=Apodospora peruviana TaxID=516989 RepID=A0AAE0IUB9_9PEZI|nr:proline-specific peptidase [Apodospora peruviana]